MELVFMNGKLVNDVQEIKRDPVAFKVEDLTFYDDGSIDEIRYRKVTFKELFFSNVGDIFEPEYGNNQYYSHETAEVIFKDMDSAFIRIRSFGEGHGGEWENMKLLHIQFF